MRRRALVCIVLGLVAVMPLLAPAVSPSESSNNGILTNDPVQPPDGGTVEVWGDWTVTDTREYHNCTIKMNGNLIIGGSLTFHNVTLIMNNSVSLQYNMNVQGYFLVSDWDNNKLTGFDKSIITTPIIPQNGYSIRVTGQLYIKYSQIERGGDWDDIDYNPTILPQGSSTVFLESNYFIDCYCIIHTPSGGGDGVKFYNNTVQNCNFLFAYYSNNWEIYGNEFKSQRIDSWYTEQITLWRGSGHRVINNTISGSYYADGVELWQVSNAIISGNQISSNCEAGIRISVSNNNTIVGNNITNNKFGVYFYGDTLDNTLQNNTIVGNLLYAICMDKTSQPHDARYNYFGTDNLTLINTLVNGTVDISEYLPYRESDFYYLNTSQVLSGSLIYNSGVIVNANISIEHADVIFNNNKGHQFIQVNGQLWVKNSSFASMDYNYTVAYTQYSQGSIINSSFNCQLGIGTRNDNFLLTNASLINGVWGLYALNCNNITISDRCTFFQNFRNVRIQNANSLYLDHFEVLSGRDEGIGLINITNGIISNGTISKNDEFGIRMSFCTGCLLTLLRCNNSVTNIYCSKGLYNNFTYLQVNNSDFKWGNGIYLYYSDYSIVSDSYVFDSSDGVILEESNWCLVTKNHIFNQNSGINLRAYQSTWFNYIYDNDIYNNSWTGIYFGTGFDWHNIVESCRFVSNGRGCFFWNVAGNNNNNTVKNCDFINNSYGVYIDCSMASPTNNKFYHNNFISSTVLHVVDQSSNIWNNSYPSGGNYWSDYSGFDVKSGPLQNQSGSDGIGDTPYVIDADSIDYYPLMSPYDYTDYNIPLQQGWNLVSLPLEQPYTMIDWILCSIDGKWDCIQTYDAVDQDHWKTNLTYRPDQLNDLDALNHKTGFWINVTQPGVVLTVSGYVPTSTSIPLYAGWNLIGYPSLNTETVGDALWGTGADRVEVFDASDPYRTKEVGSTYLMKPGEGYWIHVPADCVWVVDW